MGDNLNPSYCKLFKENLIYLFYGRPAYRAKEGNNARLEFEWPIVFIFDPEKINSVKRAFPFDTGAFDLKLYEDFFAKESKLTDFALTPSLDSAKKLVSTLYVDHAEYYHGYSRKNVELPSRQFEIQGLYELARLPGLQGDRSDHKTRDERSSAIEFQTPGPISFKEALIAIILPEPYLSDSEIVKALERWNVQSVKSYPTLHNMTGEAWVGQIYQIVHALYKELGFLDSGKTSI